MPSPCHTVFIQVAFYNLNNIFAWHPHVFAIELRNLNVREVELTI